MNLYQLNDEDYRLSYPVGVKITDALKYTVDAWNIFIQDILLHENNRRIVIWCRGSSGAILAALFSSHFGDEYNVIINHIKKEGESSHSSNIDFFVKKDDYNIIIDDHIDTGSTLINIYEVMRDYHKIIRIDCIILTGINPWGFNSGTIKLFEQTNNLIVDDQAIDIIKKKYKYIISF